MKLASETVRAFLRSIDVADASIEAGLRDTDDLRVVEALRLQVIAHAKGKGVTSSPIYADALRSLDALLRGGNRAVTKADPLFKAAAQRYASMKADAEGAVVRWEWWRGSAYEVTPFYAERHRSARGKKIAEPRDKTARDGNHEYGFDANGVVRVERSHNNLGFNETFYVHFADRIETFHYSHHRAEPINAILFLLEDGRIAERHATASQGKGIERYTYDSGRLVRITTEHTGGGGFGTEDLELIYDTLGDLEKIEQVFLAPPRRSTRYERPRKGLTLAKLLPAIRRHWLELLPAALRGLRLDEPAYALCLAMNGEAYDCLLPPVIAVGRASEREAFIQKHGVRAPDYLWRPPEWAHFAENPIELWDDRMEELTTPANQMIWEHEKYDVAFRFAHDLAKELNGMELPISRTDDFVVFACDYTAGDGPEGVKKAAPPALRRRLAQLLKLPPRPTRSGSRRQ